MKSIFILLDSIITIYLWIIIINAILSWLVAFNILNTQNRFVFAVLDATYKMTDPALNKIRRFIPTFGSIIAVLLPLPVAFLQFDAPIMIVLIIILPTIVHTIIGNIIEPKIFGKAFNLHPVTIIIALISWGIIWGVAGLLLAAPLTAIIRILFGQFETTKPIALLLSGKIHHRTSCLLYTSDAADE